MYIRSAQHAFDYLRRNMLSDVEEFWTVALGPRQKALGKRCLFRGTVDACLIHPRDIFRFGCSMNASTLIIAHNHPSHDVHPSQEDLKITHQLAKASRVMEIPIIDHLILGGSKYLSMANFQQTRHLFQVGGQPEPFHLHQY